VSRTCLGVALFGTLCIYQVRS